MPPHELNHTFVNEIPLTGFRSSPAADPETVRAVSRRKQVFVSLVFFPFGVLVLGASLAGMGWLAFRGPSLVPLQDTRVTTIIISSGSRLSVLIMMAAFVRSAWASTIPHVLAGKPLHTRSLVAICRTFISLGQLQTLDALPVSFRIHVVFAICVSLAMITTSASFRYDLLPTLGPAFATVPDVASSCPPPNASNYFCNGALNANTTGTSWSFIQGVYSGGQGTVHLYGELGDDEIGANITLAVLPEGYTLGDGGYLPWMAMWVTCQYLSIAASYSGSSYTSKATIFVNGSVIDTLDIANMPEWGSVVHLYQQVNDSGPASSLCPWKIVVLSRNLNDGSANMAGVSSDAVTELGATYLDLHGYGPVVQGVLGAAALCTFRGETGGKWQDVLWPSLNDTTNTVIGTIVDDRPTLATALLNYGPSWQYNPVSENSLPGGSVSYIANNTGPGVSFPALFASYIRNQWALMAYSITPQSGAQLSQQFTGTSGTDKLYIRVTLVAIIPAAALVVGLVFTLRAWASTISRRHWISRVEFESWWLVKALRSDLYQAGYCNATENDFDKACGDFEVRYMDLMPDDEVGHLALSLSSVDEVSIAESNAINSHRLYGLKGCDSVSPSG